MHQTEILSMDLVIIHKIDCILWINRNDRGDLVAEKNTKVLVGVLKQLRSESGTNKLGIFGQLSNHQGDTLSVLSVQSSIHLIEQIYRSRVTLLKGKEYVRTSEILLPGLQRSTPRQPNSSDLQTSGSYRESHRHQWTRPWLQYQWTSA